MESRLAPRLGKGLVWLEHLEWKVRTHMQILASSCKVSLHLESCILRYTVGCLQAVLALVLQQECRG